MTPHGEPADPARCEPLRVEAHLGGALATVERVIALDSILAAAVALRDALPPPASASECRPIEIPIAREPDGRFHLASFAVADGEEYERRWINRRFPIAEAQQLGNDKLRRITLSTGPTKSYRMPMETRHVVGDTLTWWCVGEADRIRGLLDIVGYVGKKRSVGNGKVREWRVEPCEPWEGFPVVREGQPLRPLPLDWPGLVDPTPTPGVLTYPYWDWSRREDLAAPEAA